MNLKNLTTALFVHDIVVSKRFYMDVLQQEVSLDFGINIIFKSGFAIWEIQKNHIIPATLGLGKTLDNVSSRFELYFETDTLTEIHFALKNAGVAFVHEIHEETWGQQTIRFFDPDNHLIEVGESMQQLVTRFYKQGLSIIEISERTSIAEEEVKRLLTL